MTTQHAVHSNAFNFMSFIDGGVDPRTGQYNVTLKLPAISGNALQGPEFEPSLFYSPLNREDSGYGLGWNLQLSQYTPHNQVLSLASGETYKITDRGSSPMGLLEQKLAGFYVYAEGDGLRVEHRSGLVEILSEQGSAEHQVLMTSELRSPLGRRLYFTYSRFDSRYPVLENVTDDRNEVLFSVLREGSRLFLREHPYKGPGDQPLATYQLNLGGDGRVDRIVLPGTDGGSWRFTYGFKLGFLCITEIGKPTGALEELKYDDAGHQFPPASLRTPLPRVTRHLIHPGFGQATLEHEYDYNYNNDNHNFIGGGTTIPWDDSSALDNLYNYLQPYEYGSNDHLLVDKERVRTIERRFNRLHLMTRETTIQNQHSQESTSFYDIADGKPFAEQSPTFQLAYQQNRSWSQPGRVTRTETTLSAYDNHGNLISRTLPTRVQEVSEWYGAGEEDGHPADPAGFVRHLKQTTTYPAAGGDGQAPQLCKRYRYRTLEALPGSEAAPAHVVEYETLYDLAGSTPEQALETVFTQYYGDSAETFTYGRVSQRQVSYDSEDTQATYTTTTDYQYGDALATYAAEPVLVTTQKIIGYDGQARTVRLEHSLLTGEPLLTTDNSDVTGADDIQIRYEYDALRRVTVETVAPGLAHEASRRYEYRLSSENGDQAGQWQYDVKQVMTTTWLDGLNRVISEERQDVDTEGSKGESRPIYSARFDALGQLVSETELDWLGAADLALTREFTYDDWGEQCAVKGPDDVTQHEETDPIGTAESAGSITISWREATDGTTTGRTVTWLNLFEKATRIERFAPGEDTPMSRQVNAYDGLGRLTRETVGLGVDPQVDRYRYDVFDRLLAHTLADGNVVHRQYAPHSREDLPITIAVGDTVLGRQTFDGLDRRTSADTGGRVQRFDYRPGQQRPWRMIAADGQVIEYEYQPSLTEEPYKRVLAGVPANYVHDPKNARLVSCDVPGMRVTRDYFSNGQLKEEHRFVGEGDGEVDYRMTYAFSYRERMLGYEDVQGQLQRYRYDTAGRLCQTQLCRLPTGQLPAYRALSEEPELEVLVQADFEYDVFGRNCKTTTSDLHSGQVLSTLLEYDAFERERLRTFEFTDASQALEQFYDDQDRLTRRVLSEGEAVLRDEAYDYDRRGHLILYTCTPDSPLAPVDPHGKQITRQTFRFDELDNITRVITQFPGGRNVAEYFFDNPDPAQLSSITNTHEDYPAGPIELLYDANGNMIRDESGRTLEYDALNRLQRVETVEGEASYSYDPQDILAGTTSTQ
ncbi:RHS repeat protein [Pseudomonas vlassakiae]|uniref:RHS repeat domain-containing protein n=1 Tax=Pseudomonas vlassakiae TaxID=485888 RepID=UPI000EE296F3|nr:RHS repeat domain-containing protein [Pseudomonas vlassakiae]MCU0126176.1 RHS repeat protein [Pseudomonas vlassakiae]HCV39009.1 hypothetical protein [Pseudomonas sp.]